MSLFYLFVVMVGFGIIVVDRVVTYLSRREDMSFSFEFGQFLRARIDPESVLDVTTWSSSMREERLLHWEMVEGISIDGVSAAKVMGDDHAQKAA